MISLVSINRVDPWIEITSTIISEECFLQSYSLLCWVAMPSFLFFIRWRKEKEKRKVEEVVVGFSPYESLVGVTH